MSGIMQGLAFGVFISVWLVLGLHLTSPEMGYGVDVVGYMAGLSVINLGIVPRLGAWADKVGPRYASLVCSFITFVCALLLGVTGNNLWLLMVPVLGIGLFMVVVDISGRMLLLVESPLIRTRLMTVYIALMFMGAGLSSWVATAAYDWMGWDGAVLFIWLLSSLLLLLAFISFRANRV
jgi:MFS family permease